MVQIAASSTGKPSSGWSRRGDLEERLDVERARVKANPKDGDAWKAIGVFGIMLGLYDDAVAAFNRAIELGAMSGPFWLAMAIAANRSGRPEDGLRAAEQLTVLYDDQPVYWVFKAMALESLGRRKDEKAALERAAALDPTDENKTLQALVLGRLERYDDALRMDQEAIASLEQDNRKRSGRQRAYALATQGMHLAKRATDGDAAATVEAFENAIRLLPDDPWIRQTYGVALSDLGRDEPARRVLEETLSTVQRALEREPSNGALQVRKGAVLRSLAFVLTKLGEHDRALQCDVEAVAVARHNPLYWRSMGVDLIYLGRFEEALHAFNVAIGRAPGHADMWLAKGSALWKLGEYSEGVKAFRHALSIDEEAADAWIGLGASLDALGRHREALDALRNAVGLAPERPELWSTLGRAYRGTRNAKAAEQAYRCGFALDNSMVMASGVVDALAAQDREYDALAFLQDNVPGDADVALLAYWRGVLLARLHREDEAVLEFGDAARRWAKRGVRDARATASARTLQVAEARGRGAASWVDHWFGRRSSPAIRVVGAVLLLGLLAGLAVPLTVTDALASLKFGSSWAAITLPVTVLVLLLVLPTVQSIKAGAGSFEVTTVVLQDGNRLGLTLPSDIPLEKIPDLPRLDADAARNYSDHVNGLLDRLDQLIDILTSPDAKAAPMRHEVES